MDELMHYFHRAVILLLPKISLINNNKNPWAWSNKKNDTFFCFILKNISIYKEIE